MIANTFLSRLRKLYGLSPSVLGGVLRYKILKIAGSARQFIRIRLLGRTKPRGVDIPANGKLNAGVRFFSLSEDSSKKEEVRTILEKELGVSLESIRAKAEEVCAHKLDLLGSGPVSLGEQIDWHRDFKAGTRWEPSYFSSIPEVELDNHADIKVPWELSRFYHFLTLGKAYYLTADEKYAQEFVSQFEHWTKENPPYYGVNWRVAMEVAIRAIHWVWGYYFFRDSPHFGDDTRRRFIATLGVHGDYIWNNLEFDMRVNAKRHMRHNGNHYVANLAGLIYLGVVIPGEKPRQWLGMALQELDKEMAVQVLPDGVQWETSLSYHRLVLEMCLSAVLLCQMNGIEVPQSLLSKIESMCEFTMHYTKPDGLCPLVRDADDGRLCWLNNDDFRDHRHVMAVGGTIFKRRDLLAHAAGRWQDLLWLLGLQGIRQAKDIHFGKMELSSRAFKETGFYVLRDGSRSHMFVICADIGMGGIHGGHAHNDCLSFEVFHDGATFLTDCGSYSYGGDPKWRNRFRSTAYHNTARVDGAEINRFSEAELFYLQNDAKPKVLEWHTTSEFDFLSAVHFGYQRLPQPVLHTRNFFFDKVVGNVIIDDVFDGVGEHLLEVFFHFFPGVEIRQVSTDCYHACARNAWIQLSFHGEGKWTSKLRQGWVSDRYGRKSPSHNLLLSCRQVVPAKLRTMIHLGSSPDPEAMTHRGESILEKSLESYSNLLASYRSGAGEPFSARTADRRS